MARRRWRSRPQLVVRRAARRQLSRRLGAEKGAAVVARANDAYPAVAARIPKTRLGARNLLRTGAYAIALHRALVEARMDPGAANSLISDVVFAAILPGRDAFAMLAGLRHRDRLQRANWASDVAQRFYFTQPDWEMSDVPVDGGFGMDITRCVVAEFFASLGMSELCQRAICDQDARVAAHHGLDFARSGTLAGGADRCDFRYSVPTAGQSR